MQASRSLLRNFRRLPARRLFTIAPFVVVAVGAAFIGALARTPEGQIAAGVHVGDLDLSGKSLEEARAVLDQWVQKQQAATLRLYFAPETKIRRVWKPTAKQLGLGIDAKATLEEAARAGQEGVLGRVSGWITGQKTIQVAPHTAVQDAATRTYLQRIASRINRRARNARFVLLRHGGFAIHHEKPGLSVDVPASVAAIVQAWNSALTPSTDAPAAQAEQSGTPHAKPQASDAPPSTPSAQPQPLSVELATKAIQAAITAADLKQIDGVLGGYTTTFGGTGANRGNNIALAASHINGTLLGPGEVFSYNRVVGPRVGSAGFRDAPVIIHGELVPGVGGGVCQVSSTLYNAVLLSDLKIVRRSHHAFPVHYLPAGRDATVVDGSLDFQFQNNTDAPIYIAASARGGRLSFRIFGKKQPGRSVSIELANHSVQPAPTELRSDPTLPAGRRVVKDRGHRGHRVTVYRIVRENGRVVRRELISRDRYRPYPAIILVGTGRAASRPIRRVSRHAARPATLTTAPKAPAAPPADPTPTSAQ